MSRFRIGDCWIGETDPVYFVADIAANHDGDLERAKRLIALAHEAGANAAKFQNFRAAKIVSEYGFGALGGQLSHQAKWTKSVTEVYEDAAIPFEWTPVLKKECDRIGIEYFSAPYDLEAADMLDAHVNAYKIGSGDIDWLESIRHIAGKGKPVLLATGAATLEDVTRAVDTILAVNPDLVLMQCNTNYTASLENFRHVHLNVLRTYSTLYPDLVLGLSDHTPGHATVLGSIALGARVIEKHFTEDPTRDGPDHAFSMDPESWAEMVGRARELELALGDPVKRVAENEEDAAMVQRRCLRAACGLEAKHALTREMIDVLRPATANAITPDRIGDVLGMQTRRAMTAGEALCWTDLEKVN
jgi:N-acetylneuraminate synthase